ncbi:MAG: hypothetical protein C0617_10960 [Desulfuromonas sp.]|uniref:hypothetical protein n=1 Tax=Desulfuromonas sp. TaxID=892 RepID=UPI000CBDA5E7|nr:hypothetical protein [Desulfuromonas sp.]PLX83647.1 MAG: hypothetical protein C0617_10960 [Desulfuromonas sp.]
MGVFSRKDNRAGKRVDKPKEEGQELTLVTDCYCANGHNLTSDLATFDGFNGITITLRNSRQEGLLCLSPLIGDTGRSFFNFEGEAGEIVEICCPTCSEPLPVYNECVCGADLVAFFSSPKVDFGNCIGICQRIGCLHSEIKSNRDLRLFSRRGFFD